MKRTHVLLAVLLLLALLPGAGPDVNGQSSTPIFINEIHYDNASTDAGEAIEVAGPAGTALSGWSLVLYNGNGGTPYNTTALSGTLPDQQDGFGTVDIPYPVNGIQNGSPDGIALVNPSGIAVQFLSYEGTFAAVGGPADGMTSTDIGVTEPSDTPIGYSLQLTGSGTVYEDFAWAAAQPNTFGAVNTGQSFGSGAGMSDPILNEFVFNHTGTDTNEFVEVAGDPNTDYSAFTIVEIEGDGAGAGVLDDAITVGTTGAAGYWTTGFQNNRFENGTVTLLLVEGYSGSVGQDLDSDDDGTLDATPWTGVVDSVAVFDGDTGDQTYGVALVPGYDGVTFTVGGASRIPDQTDSDSASDWVRNDFDGAGLPGFTGTPDPGEALNTPGATNELVPPPTPDVVINEIMQNPAVVGDDTGEWFELYNAGSSDVDVNGWTIADNGADSHVINNGGPLSVPAGGFLVLGNNADSAANGGVTVDYSYGSGWFLANSDDEVILLDAGGNEVDRVEYDGGPEFPDPTGASMSLQDPTLDNNVGANWCESTTPYGDGDLGTPGAANTCEPGGGEPVPASIYEIQFTSDPGGASPYAGMTVVTEGIVTAVFDGGDVAFIQDGAGPWSGLFLFNPDTALSVGDAIQVTGDVVEFFGLTELVDGAVTLLSSGNLLPAPELLPTGSVAQEQWESVLVRVENLYVADPALGFGEWSVGDGSGPVRVDDLGSYSYVPQADDALAYVQGPLNYTFSDFKIEPRDDADIGPVATIPLCERPATFVHTVQGDGAASPLQGQTVSIEGVVVGDFQYGDSGPEDVYDNNLNGFYVQEEDAEADANPLTSEGVFVYDWDAPDVNIGDHVRVTGVVAEYSTSGGASLMTQISNVSQIEICGEAALPAVTQVTLPVSDVNDFERYEGMFVTFPQELVIAEFFNYDRFGEIVLATPTVAGRLFQPTSYLEDTGEIVAALDLIARSRITLDDGRSNQNPDPAIHPNGDIFTTADPANRFRGGDLVQYATGVVDNTFGLYRIQPVQGADYTAANPRPAAPDDVGGSLQVASFNVLNYFLTLDDGENDICGPNLNQECRGADTAEEFVRQRTKILSALATIEADVFGLIEMENTTGVSPLADIVAGLNDMMGAGTYAYIDTGTIGTDAIKVGIVYRPDSVTPLGSYAILDSSVDARFDDSRNRPVLAQSFIENDSGGIFTVAVNHLKSKGSGCGPGDDDPYQGNCNLTRTLAAQALVDWLATDPTGSGDTDFLITGDLNAYDKEDPIDAILAGPDDILGTADDYLDLVFQFEGEFAYSYVFDGQLGYLDHALASPGLVEEVTGTTVWHINADEPDIIDYDMTFKRDAQDALYEPNAYRASDHDPVIVGLDLRVPDAQVMVTPDMLWPPNHKYVTVEAQVFGDLAGVALVSVTSDEPDAGLDDEDLPFDIVILDDYTFDLRAERYDEGDGRTYTITYFVTDYQGDSTFLSATVFVPHDQRTE